MNNLRQEVCHPSFIELDSLQLIKNIEIIKNIIFPTKFCFPVKANGYGHGLFEMAKIATEAKVDYLAVAHAKEALFLREKGIKGDILVLGAVLEEQILPLIEEGCEFSVSSPYKAQLIKKQLENSSLKAVVHLEVDTGMQRTGMRPETALSLFNELLDNDSIEVKGIYSHLAMAQQPEDPFTKRQIEAFTLLADHLKSLSPSILCHLANSAGLLYFSKSHFSMVRAGFLTLGYFPSHQPEKFLEIKPCFSLKSKISFLKWVEEGKGISYGHAYITNKKTKIATVPVGYGDGYRTEYGKRGEVLIKGKKVPIVGVICMDQLMCDVTDLDVEIGDEAVLIGKQGDQEILINEMAKRADISPYEVLASFTQRLERKVL